MVSKKDYTFLMFKADMDRVLMAMKFNSFIVLQLIGETETIVGGPYELSYSNRWIVKVVDTEGKPRVCEFEDSYGF